jgi:hypothetical protein
MSDNGRPKDGVLDDSLLRDGCPIGAVAGRYQCGVGARRQGCEGDFAIAGYESSPLSNGVRIRHSLARPLLYKCPWSTDKGPDARMESGCQTSSKHANRRPRPAFIARHIDHRERALLALAVQSPAFADQNPFELQTRRWSGPTMQYQNRQIGFKPLFSS